jgi:excisionase family DNA binding protein
VKMLLKHLVEGELNQISTKKLKVAVDTILLDINQASIFLNVKISKLRSFVFYRKIPYVKLGKLIRFKQEDLNEFIKKNTKEAMM